MGMIGTDTRHTKPMVPICDRAHGMTMLIVAASGGLVMCGDWMGWRWMAVAGVLIGLLSVTLVATVVAYMDGSPWMMRLAGRLLGLEPVEIMDLSKRRRLTLARAMPDGTHEAMYCAVFGHGKVRLLPCGLVDPDCECSHIYLWRPLDRELLVSLVLGTDSWPDWEEWGKLSHIDMLRRRKAALQDQGRP